MRQVMIQQKDFVTYTTFMYGGGGAAFPEDNYQIAKRWLSEGKLCESSMMEMEDIEKAREKREVADDEASKA